MKVDRNHTVGGVPLRLQIAAQLMAGDFATDMFVAAQDIPEHCKSYLHWADDLIAAHNATCEETPQ